MKSTMRLSFVMGLLIAASVVACAKSEQPAVTQQGTAADVAAARHAIDSGNAIIANAAEKGDAAAAAAVYDSSAMLMPQGMNASAGRSAIQTTFGGLISQFAISNFKLATQDVAVSGDFAIETGRYSWTLTPKGGKAMTDSGKYVVVWKKQADGTWKVYRDISNNDAPPAAPTTKK